MTWMYRGARGRALLGACLAVLAGCGPGGRPPASVDDDVPIARPDVVRPDVQANTDAPRTDAVSADAGDAVASDGASADAGLDVSAVDAGPDVPPVPTDAANPCAPGAVIDLEMVGTRVGATTTYAGTTAALPATSAIQTGCVAGVGSVLALRYTPATLARLRVSTFNSGTPMTFDTVAWLLDRCAPDGTPLGCADDSPTPVGDPRSTFTTPTTAAAGTPTYLFVGGFVPTRPGYVSAGAFRVTITEIAEVPVGGTCDPSGATNLCAPGAHCIDDTAPARCIADGAPGGQCRAPAPGCDGAYACSNDRLSSMSRCVPLVERGGVCDPTRRTNACTPGTMCLVFSEGPVCW